MAHKLVDGFGIGAGAAKLGGALLRISCGLGGTAGAQEKLSATVAVESGGSVPITWVSSNPGVWPGLLRYFSSFLRTSK